MSPSAALPFLFPFYFPPLSGVAFKLKVELIYSYKLHVTFFILAFKTLHSLTLLCSLPPALPRPAQGSFCTHWLWLPPTPSVALTHSTFHFRHSPVPPGFLLPHHSHSLCLSLPSPPTLPGLPLSLHEAPLKTALSLKMKC